MNSLLRIKHDPDIQWCLQPSKEIVAAFAEGNGPDPALVPMRLAFGYKKKEAWNRCLGEQFLDDFLEREGSNLHIRENEWPLIHEIIGSASRTSRRSGKSGRRRTARMISRFAIVISQISNWT
jgi:hypothetical protein